MRCACGCGKRVARGRAERGWMTAGPRCSHRVRMRRSRGQATPIVVINCAVCEHPVMPKPNEPGKRGGSWHTRYHKRCPICHRECCKEARKANRIIRSLREDVNNDAASTSHPGENGSSRSSKIPQKRPGNVGTAVAKTEGRRGRHGAVTLVGHGAREVRQHGRREATARAV